MYVTFKCGGEADDVPYKLLRAPHLKILKSFYVRALCDKSPMDENYGSPTSQCGDDATVVIKRCSFYLRPFSQITIMIRWEKGTVVNV